jgi:hypothetical protein
LRDDPQASRRLAPLLGSKFDVGPDILIVVFQDHSARAVQKHSATPAVL